MDKYQLTLGEMHHKDHREWLSQLNFYQDEIKILQNELMLTLHKHPESLSILEHVDEYRSIFMRKLQRIDRLRHQIILHEKLLSIDLNPKPDNIWDHHEIRLEMEGFVRDFELLKHNFRGFVAHNM